MVLLDEPFSSLNLGLKRKLWHLLKKMQREHGWTLLLVTHDLEEALLLGDDLSLIANGALVDSGPKNQVYCYPKTVSAACILGTENFLPAEFAGRSDGLCYFHCPDFPAKLSVSASYPTLAGDSLDKLRFKLGIKAADIKLCRADSASAAGCCSIEAIHEKGCTATLVLRSKNAAITLLAEVALKDLVGHALGDEVGIIISPEAIMALVER
jgi:ABC-type Fe3+/spermidine/putrescine transport system ATPase subunit